MAVTDRTSSSQQETKTFKLTKPILTHDGMVEELAFKPATAGLFIRYGTPYTYSKAGTVNLDMKVIFDFASSMSGHDVILLSDMAPYDVMPMADFIFGMVALPPRIG